MNREAERLAALERVLWPTGLKLEEAVPLVAGLLSLKAPERYPALQLPPQEARKRPDGHPNALAGGFGTDAAAGDDARGSAVGDPSTLEFKRCWPGRPRRRR